MGTFVVILLIYETMNERVSLLMYNYSLQSYHNKVGTCMHVPCMYQKVCGVTKLTSELYLAQYFIAMWHGVTSEQAVSIEL